jgi:hypothetical protein
MDRKLTAEEIGEIERIMREQECPHDFKCYQSGFKDLCGAAFGPKLDSEQCIECKDERVNRCRYASSFGTTFTCTCPLRRYIARHLNI